MANLGRMLYVGGIGFGVFFAALTACSYVFLYFLNEDTSYGLLEFTFFLGIPLALTAASFWAVRVGHNMQHGASGRAGGVYMVAVGLLFILMTLGTLTLFISDPLKFSRENSTLSLFSGIGTSLAFGIACLAWGYSLMTGKQIPQGITSHLPAQAQVGLNNAPYVFAAPEPEVYASRKKTLGLAIVICVPLVFLLFYFFVE
jgi:hypothetical protein